jgi:hypothetical protein
MSASSAWRSRWRSSASRAGVRIKKETNSAAPRVHEPQTHTDTHTHTHRLEQSRVERQNSQSHEAKVTSKWQAAIQLRVAGSRAVERGAAAGSWREQSRAGQRIRERYLDARGLVRVLLQAAHHHFLVCLRLLQELFVPLLLPLHLALRLGQRALQLHARAPQTITRTRTRATNKHAHTHKRARGKCAHKTTTCHRHARTRDARERTESIRGKKVEPRAEQARLTLCSSRCPADCMRPCIPAA